jgi:hypothetical protein
MPLPPSKEDVIIALLRELVSIAKEIAAKLDRIENNQIAV